MNNKNTNNALCIFTGVFILSLIAGCAVPPPGTQGVGSGSQYTPVIDGEKNEKYYSDLRECRQIAYDVQRQQQSQAAGSVIAGALVGALIGSQVGNYNQAELDGAVVGGVIAGAGELANAADSGKTVIRNCMIGRGYNVLL